MRYGVSSRRTIFGSNKKNPMGFKFSDPVFPCFSLLLNSQNWKNWNLRQYGHLRAKCKQIFSLNKKIVSFSKCVLIYEVDSQPIQAVRINYDYDWKFDTLLVRRANSSFLLVLSWRNAFQGNLGVTCYFSSRPLPLFTHVESLILFVLYISQTMCTRLLDWRWFRLNGIKTFSAWLSKVETVVDGRAWTAAAPSKILQS